MRDAMCLGAGMLLGSLYSGCHLIPAHRADARAMESELGSAKVRAINLQAAADAANARQAAAWVEVDQLRRQLQRERDIGRGATEFGEVRPAVGPGLVEPFGAEHFIPPAGVPER